jgi:hypothetical protein
MQCKAANSSRGLRGHSLTRLCAAVLRMVMLALLLAAAFPQADAQPARPPRSGSGEPGAGRGPMARGPQRGDGPRGAQAGRPGFGQRRGPMARQRAERQELMQFRVLDRISRMAPEDRQRLLSRLPADRRRRMEANLRRLESMPPERRDMIAQRLRQFEQMTPERQDRLRSLTREMSNLPQDRRSLLRQEFVRLQRMSDEDRLDYVESPRFRDRFSERERELLVDLADTAPPPPPPPSRNPPADSQPPDPQ